MRGRYEGGGSAFAALAVGLVTLYWTFFLAFIFGLI